MPALSGEMVDVELEPLIRVARVKSWVVCVNRIRSTGEVVAESAKKGANDEIFVHD